MTDPTPDIVLDRAEQQMRDWERGRSIDIRAVIDLIGDLYTEVRALRDQRDTATDALRHITNGQQCETYTRPPYCRDPQSGRSRDAHYGAERWCDTCIALDALPAADRPPTGTPDTGDDYTGRLCSRSFASHPENHVDSIAGAEGWGRCRTCGEVLNTSGERLPEHIIPGSAPVAAVDRPPTGTPAEVAITGKVLDYGQGVLEIDAAGEPPKPMPIMPPVGAHVTVSWPPAGTPDTGDTT